MITANESAGDSSWTYPTADLDKLLALSYELGPETEITPVQMWHQIQNHPNFGKFTSQDLSSLQQLLADEVNCFA